MIEGGRKIFKEIQQQLGRSTSEKYSSGEFLKLGF
jgi:hypothetical protein